MKHIIIYQIEILSIRKITLHFSTFEVAPNYQQIITFRRKKLKLWQWRIEIYNLFSAYNASKMSMIFELKIGWW